MGKEGELRFYPTGSEEVVVRSGRQLADSAVRYVHPQAVAAAFGEDHAREYETAMSEKRRQK